MQQLEFALGTGDVAGIDHEGLAALRSGLEKTLHVQAAPEEELYDAALALGLNPTQCCPAPCALNSLQSSPPITARPSPAPYAPLHSARQGQWQQPVWAATKTSTWQNASS
jgi:hypothetical protein